MAYQNGFKAITENDYRDNLVLQIISKYGRHKRGETKPGRLYRSDCRVKHGSQVFDVGQKSRCQYCYLNGYTLWTQRKCLDRPFQPALSNCQQRLPHKVALTKFRYQQRSLNKTERVSKDPAGSVHWTDSASHADSRTWSLRRITQAQQIKSLYAFCHCMSFLSCLWCVYRIVVLSAKLIVLCAEVIFDYRGSKTGSWTNELCGV